MILSCSAIFLSKSSFCFLIFSSTAFLTSSLSKISSPSFKLDLASLYFLYNSGETPFDFKNSSAPFFFFSSSVSKSPFSYSQSFQLILSHFSISFFWASSPSNLAFCSSSSFFLASASLAVFSICLKLSPFDKLAAFSVCSLILASHFLVSASIWVL